MWIEMSCVIVASFCELEIYSIYTTFFTIFKDSIEEISNSVHTAVVIRNVLPVKSLLFPPISHGKQNTST